MTVSIAWERDVHGVSELVFVSDSRLGGGVRWDQCPKIMTLPRSDVAICFAGSSHYTYPIMNQFSMAINSYNRSRERAMDITHLKGHSLQLFNGMLQAIKVDRTINKRWELQDTEFIMGGYSWIHKKFNIWKVRYKKDPHNQIKDRFESVGPTQLRSFGPIVFAGDQANAAKVRLVELMRKKYGLNPFDPKANIKWDWEPFEVVRDMLREGTIDTIGGPPQVVKVYQSMTCKPIGVFWEENGQRVNTLMGRTMFDYESSDYWFLDPDTLFTSQLL